MGKRLVLHGIYNSSLDLKSDGLETMLQFLATSGQYNGPSHLLCISKIRLGKPCMGF